MSVPTFYFFKMFGCGACNVFAPIFDRLTQDPDLRRLVVLERVEFGHDSTTGQRYDLSDYPQFASRVQYAPFLWLGTHDSGQELRFTRGTTAESVKAWILAQVASSSRGAFRKGRRKTSRTVKAA